MGSARRTTPEPVRPPVSRAPGAPQVVVAMSGGVDSSVAAALLVQQGYECIGVTLQVWPSDLPETEREGGCCSLGAVTDARQVAAALGIPYYVLNYQEIFQTHVIDDFVAEYRRGRTPNPCIRCNKDIKFAALLRHAEAIGASHVATGHYARILRDPASGRYLLLRGRDRHKDQSYVLYSLDQEQLAHILFPLGDFTKDQTRAVAERLGLRVAHKAESQEICFVPSNNYRDFLGRVAPEVRKPGPILDTAGRKLGEHPGIAFYTIGQRKGLGLAYCEPLYVVDLDPERNAVIVGTAREVWRAGLLGSHANWVSVPELAGPLKVEVQIRYNSKPVPARIEPGPGPGQVACYFGQPQRAVTPGQAAVFYQGDRLVGGATIERPLPVTKAS